MTVKTFGINTENRNILVTYNKDIVCINDGNNAILVSKHDYNLIVEMIKNNDGMVV